MNWDTTSRKNVLTTRFQPTTVSDCRNSCRVCPALLLFSLNERKKIKLSQLEEVVLFIFNLGLKG